MAVIERGYAEASFHVVATPSQARRFRRVAGHRPAAPGDTTLPKTFPIVWLMRRNVQDLVRKRFGQFVVPVHIGQDFIYTSDLRVGCPYRLELRFSVSNTPSDQPSFRIRAHVIDPRTDAQQATIVATFLLKPFGR